MKDSCSNCALKAFCEKSIRQMASDEELKHIVCLEHLRTGVRE